MGKQVNIAIGAIIAIVLIAAAVALVAGRTGADEGERLRAVVHDGDGGVRELPLSQDAEMTVVTSKGTNVVAVESGAVFVREADCDNHDCMRQGRIDAPGRQIICLPHELWIEVVADGDASGQMDVDAAAGGSGEYDVIAR